MTPPEALSLLTDLGASPRLTRHAELVGEAARSLVDALSKLDIPVDRDFVAIGAILHDAGKTLHPDELSAGGALHEPAGERLLLERGVSPEIARVCRSHAQWASMACSFEELVIALADKLWKGVRNAALEDRVITEAANRRGADKWGVFIALDGAFESIASLGDERLARSAG